MAKKAGKDFKVVIRFVPCDPGEWEDALDSLAGLMAQACLKEKMRKCRELDVPALSDGQPALEDGQAKVVTAGFLGSPWKNR